MGARSLPGRRVSDRPGLGSAHGRGRAVEAPQFLTEARQRFVTAIGLRGWRDAPIGFPCPGAMLLLAIVSHRITAERAAVCAERDNPFRISAHIDAPMLVNGFL